jgi:hypothetical protein
MTSETNINIHNIKEKGTLQCLEARELKNVKNDRKMHTYDF